MSDKIPRRRYLKSVSVASLIGLAGCATDDGGGDGDGGGAEETAGTETGATEAMEATEETEAMEETETTEGDGGEQGAIQMGSVLPVTGNLEAYGSGMQAAVDLAVEHVNSAGGPLGRQIEMYHTDSQTRPEAGVNRFESLVTEQEIIGFVGAASSGVSTPIAERVADEGVMQVSNASTSPVLAELGYDGETKFFARTAPNDAQQGIVMGQVLNQYIEAESAAFLYVDNPYGEGLANTASDAFDGETTDMVGYAQDAADYTSTLEQVFAGDPDAVGFVGYPGNGVTIMQQWSDGGFGGEWVFSEGLNSQSDFVEPLADTLEGFYFASPQPEETEGVSRFEEQMGDQNTLFAPHAYDALFLQALAIHRAGEASGRAIAENIRTVSRSEGETVTVGQFDRAKELLDNDEAVNYEGASSPVNMNENLEPLNRFAILQIQDGGTETLETIPRSEFEGVLSE